MTVADPGDLTARARIRDAAMRQFGEHGFERATIRGIAQAAGVSSGLVRHHFGSKQGLMDACDAHLVRVLRQLNEQVAERRTGEMPNPVSAARAAMGPFEQYLARSLVEGRAADLFDTMVELGAGWFAKLDESRADAPEVTPRERAAVFTAMVLSVTVLREHVGRGLGVDLFSPAGDDRLARVLIDLYSHPVMSADDAAEARAELDWYQGKERHR